MSDDEQRIRFHPPSNADILRRLEDLRGAFRELEGTVRGIQDWRNEMRGAYKAMMWGIAVTGGLAAIAAVLSFFVVLGGQ